MKKFTFILTKPSDQGDLMNILNDDSIVFLTKTIYQQMLNSKRNDQNSCGRAVKRV